MRRIMSRGCCAFTRRIRPRFGYAATQAALWNLHRVMAIKDEVYVAWLLSSEEKYEHDRDRYNVRPELGDRMIHRHLNRPEFTFGGRTLRFKLKTRPWMLRLMRRGKFLRRLLPAWHAQGTRLPRTGISISPTNSPRPPMPPPTPTWLKILRLPEEATGYREVRYPRMAAAQNRAKELLASLSSPAAAYASSAEPTASTFLSDIDDLAVRAGNGGASHAAPFPTAEEPP